MKDQQSKQQQQQPEPVCPQEPHNKISEYYEAYRASMNIMPVDFLSSAKLFRKHGIQYNPQGTFHKFSHKIVQSYLRHQIITIKINLTYFTLSAHVLNDFGENPFARISPNQDGKYGSLYFYRMDSCCMAIKSFDYTEGDFHVILERALLEWSVLKICSALECAPRLEHCLGFDLVIYEDCIQMAMEKCVSLREMPSRWFDPLKQELEIIHSFNIIHADIKPDNIVFSPSLNKPVFIDFGFSSVIKEVPGQKKKSLFKGSPGFCSPEMLNLLSLDNLNEYIDLYYNDLHCLKICFKDSADSEQTLESNNDQTISFQEFLNQQTVLRQPTRLYFHYRFKYNYISENIHELRSLLENKTIVKSEIAVIIKFMRDIFQHFFHLQIMEGLKDYSFTHEYKLLMRQLSLERSKIRLYVKQQAINEGDQQQVKDFSSRFNHFLLKNEGLEIYSSINFKTYSLFLLSDDYYILPKERCLDLLLHCLRFNIRNVPYKVKTQIAAKWRKILTKEDSLTCKESFENIKYFFKYLLNYCKEQPLNEWKRNNYFEVLFHSILLGIDSLDIFTDFLGMIDQMKSSLMDKLILETYLVQLEDRLNALNLAAESNASALNFLVILYKEVRKLAQDVENAQASDYGQDAQIILHLMKEIKKVKTIGEQDQHFKHLHLILKQVKNKRLYVYYNGVIFQRKLRYHIEQHPTNQLLQMIRKMMKQEDVLENLNIHVLFQVSETFMLKLELDKQFKRMINEIKDIIGCNSIIQKFKMDKHLFLIDRQNRDIDLIKKYLKQLDRCYNQLQLLDTGVKRQLYYLVSKIKANHVDNTIKELLLSLYYKYRKTKDCFVWNIQYRLVDFQEILLKLDIEKEFISVLPELLPDLQQKISIMKKKLHKIHKAMKITTDQNNILISSNIRQVCKFVMLRYEYFQSKDYYYLLVDNRKQQLKYLLNLANLSATLKLHLIYDHICYRIILLSNRLKEEIIFSQFVHQQYIHALANQSPVHYLLSSKHLLLIYTLKYFHKIGSMDKIIAVMSMINLWINQNPLQSYLRSYIDCLEDFYLNFPTFFQYKTLKNSFPCGKNSKPYICVLLIFCALAAQQEKEKIQVLRAICLMLSRLTTYARQQILQRFHLVFASLKSISHRKVQMYLLRHNKLAFKGKPYSSFLTKRLKNRLSDCPKRAALRECLSRLL